MARSVAWRRTCPDVIAQRTEQVLQSTIYILHEIGPTAFVLKEEESRKKVKVVALNFFLFFFCPILVCYKLYYYVHRCFWVIPTSAPALLSRRNMTSASISSGKPFSPNFRETLELKNYVHC